MKRDDALALGLFMNVAPDLFKPPKHADVRHRQTCPCCGKKLVNLYRYQNEWLCRICLIAAKHVDGGAE